MKLVRVVLEMQARCLVQVLDQLEVTGTGVILDNTQSSWMVLVVESRSMGGACLPVNVFVLVHLKEVLRGDFCKKKN